MEEIKCPMGVQGKQPTQMEPSTLSQLSKELERIVKQNIMKSSMGNNQRSQVASEVEKEEGLLGVMISNTL
jgi:hypothetical protein